MAERILLAKRAPKRRNKVLGWVLQQPGGPLCTRVQAQEGRDLAPVDLQFVFDRFDTVDAANKLLSHLLLVERADGAFEADFVAVGGNVNLPGREAVAFAESSANLGKERSFGSCIFASG